MAGWRGRNHILVSYWSFAVNGALAGVKGVDQHGRLAGQESYTGFILELQQSIRGLAGPKDPFFPVQFQCPKGENVQYQKDFLPWR